jgi:hypothetical protein
VAPGSELKCQITFLAVTAAEAEAQRSMLSGMFSFMKKTKRIRHNPESEGIYLSDLNAEELDPEVAALYFPTSYRQGGHADHLAAGSCCIPPSPASVTLLVLEMQLCDSVTGIFRTVYCLSYI